MNVRELIEMLEEHCETCGDYTEVRLAFQPQWPLEYSIADCVLVGGDDDEDNDNDDEKKKKTTPIIYLSEEQQLGYLPPRATRLLGWGRRRR